MHIARHLAAVLLAAAIASPAHAQVTLDLKALDQLHITPGSPPQPAPAPAEVPSAGRPAQAAPKGEAARKPSRKEMAEQRRKEAAERRKAAPASASPPAPNAATAAAKPPPAVLPNTTPPQVRLSPIVPEPGPPPAPTKPRNETPVVAEDAGGAASPIAGGVRVTFDGGRAEVSPSSADSIKRFADAAPKTDTASFNVLGFAAGAPEDPSTPRRLSLSRALAVRSLLMAEGIPSTQIYVRALGPAPPGEPPDRVDITVAGGNGP